MNNTHLSEFFSQLLFPVDFSSYSEYFTLVDHSPTPRVLSLESILSSKVPPCRIFLLQIVLPLQRYFPFQLFPPVNYFPRRVFFPHQIIFYAKYFSSENCSQLELEYSPLMNNIPYNGNFVKSLLPISSIPPSRIFIFTDISLMEYLTLQNILTSRLQSPECISYVM